MNRTFLLNDVKLEKDERIEGFRILSRKSSNVEYFGIYPEHKKLFVQFKNGKSYIYTDVEPEVLTAAIEAESIGKFINANVVKKYISLKYDSRLVTELKEGEVA